MKNIDRGDLKYTFDFRHKSVLEVEPGEEFSVETEDAPSGEYRTPGDAAKLLDVWYLRHSPSMANPLTGPIYIKGVEPGDTLVITIVGIELDKQGVTYWRPGHKPLGDSVEWRDLAQPTLVIAKLDKGTIDLTEALTLEDHNILRHPLKLQLRQAPFIGTIAMAPEREVEASGMGQGSWGGNLDVRDICAGTKVYLPCFNEGGLLYLGDVHAGQGDTEIYGIALEARSTVTLRCDVIKRQQYRFVRLEKPDSIISIASAKPLEEAVTKASLQLMEWLVQGYGCSQREAYLLLGVNPDFRVNVYQMHAIGRLQFTAGAEIMKGSLPSHE